MAKERVVFVCENCGVSFPKWMGRCTACNEWSTLVESVEIKKAAHPSRDATLAIPYSEIDISPADRMETGFSEIDRLLGGGLVRGSLVLVGGDPGIGKSTLMLQVASGLQRSGQKVLYVSGEESPAQVKLRGNRIGLTGDPLFMLPVRDMDAIEAEVARLRPSVLILDSIQTMMNPNMLSVPGSITQVREATNRLLVLAKEQGVACFIIGHITKDGAIAGPKSLEHMVDAVLYFEGDRLHSNRILRVQKNRFGSASELCLFTMEENGLQPVTNPSLALLKERPAGSSGSVVACCIEGTQSLCFEIQALVSSGVLGNPRRMTEGLDHNRVAMLLAVMEKRLGCHLGGEDVFINVPGGLYIDDPGLDLPVVAAVWSSLRRKPVDPHTAVFGEIGLAGEVRAVSSCDKRIAEAKALGFHRIVMPATNLQTREREEDHIELLGVRNLKDSLEHIMVNS